MNKKKYKFDYFEKGIIPKKFKPDFYSGFLSKVNKKHMKFLKDNKLLSNRIVYGVNHENINQVFELGIQNIIVDYNEVFGGCENLELLLKQNQLHYTQPLIYNSF